MAQDNPMDKSQQIKRKTMKREYVKPTSQVIRLMAEGPLALSGSVASEGSRTYGREEQESNRKGSIWNNDSWGGLDGE